MLQPIPRYWIQRRDPVSTAVFFTAIRAIPPGHAWAYGEVAEDIQPARPGPRRSGYGADRPRHRRRRPTAWARLSLDSPSYAKRALLAAEGYPAVEQAVGSVCR